MAPPISFILHTPHTLNFKSRQNESNFLSLTTSLPVFQSGESSICFFQMTFSYFCSNRKSNPGLVPLFVTISVVLCSQGPPPSKCISKTKLDEKNENPSMNFLLNFVFLFKIS